MTTAPSLKSLVAKPLLGGLDTKNPPHLVSPAHSPDLLNVLLGNNSVQRRGGFVPMIREHPKGNAIRNRGIHGKTRTSNATNVTDTKSLIVPGCMFAGHRRVYEDIRSAYTVEFFVRVLDLSAQHSGNGETNGSTVGYSTPLSGNDVPYTIKVRPIFSKGPAKKTTDQTSTGVNAASAWARANVWAPQDAYYNPAGTQPGMPYCLYLYNNGTGTAPDWQLRFSFHQHRVSTGIAELRTLVSAQTIKVGVVYHVIATVNYATGISRLRVGPLTDDLATPTYLTETGTWDTPEYSPVSCTTGPIQVFDCPQAFVDAPAAGRAGGAFNRPAGLGLGAWNAGTDLDAFPNTSGGYFFACKRFEGEIEDIAIYGEDALAGSLSALDRNHKLDWTRTTFRLVSYWSMDLDGDQYVQERTGLGNHLYFVPNGPVFDDPNDGPRLSGSWWFNGVTSYAAPILHLTNEVRPWDETRPHTVWRWYYGVNTYGTFQLSLSNNLGHGLRAVFWLDSIEPNFEQVIMEIQGAMRLVVTETGKLACYVRNAAGSGYQNRIESTRKLQCGVRYHVSFLRRGTAYTMRINGFEEASANTLAADASGNDYPVQCVTIGMGSRHLSHAMMAIASHTVGTAHQVTITNGHGFLPGKQFFVSMLGIIGTAATALNKEHLATAISRTVFSVPVDTSALTANGGTALGPALANIDSRSGFCGRIEMASIMAGDDEDPATGETIYPVALDEAKSDQVYDQVNQWQVPDDPTVRNLVKKCRLNDLAARIGTGHMMNATPGRSQGFEGRYAIKDSQPAGSTTSYDLVPPVVVGVDSDDGGIYQAIQVGSLIYWTLARWDFSVNDEDNLYAGGYVRGVYEHRHVAQADEYRGVHVQLSGVQDEMGLGMRIEKRCIESDWMTERDSIGAPAGNEYYARVHTHRNAPYDLRSPRELCPKFCTGLVLPLTGGNPISLLASYDHQESGQRLMVVGSGRQLYWAKPVWRAGSPFDSEPNTLLAWSHGGLGDHIQAGPVATDAGAPYSTTQWKPVVFEGFFRPDILQGTLLLAANANLTNGRWNLVIYLKDGFVNVMGTTDAGTRAWRYFEGEFTGANTIPYPHIVPGKWNHVHITVGDNGSGGNSVQVRINGQFCTMTADTTYHDAMTGTPDVSSTGYLYGLPRLYAETPLSYVTVATGTRSLSFSSIRGMLTEVRSRNTKDTTTWPDGQSGIVPKSRFTAAPGDGILLRLNEGVGWVTQNYNASGADDPNVEIRFTELVTIAEGLEESAQAPYRYAVFRDSLFVTNGRSKPQEIRFLGYSKEQPFAVSPMGIQAPYVGRLVQTQARTDAAATTKWSAGSYQAWVSFEDDQGRESEPVQVYGFDLGSSTNTYAFYIRNIPRSHQPHVTRRKVYLSLDGGGTAVFTMRIPENNSTDAELYLPGDSTDPIVVGERLVPPKARLISVGNGSIFLANLTETSAGKGAFAWSSGISPTYFPLINTVNVDSEDGRQITSIRAHLGKLYLFKRDSTWAFEFSGARSTTQPGAALYIVNKSVGLAGAATIYDNALYGAGDRGIYRFDGSNPRYTSDMLKNDWPLVDHTDEAFLRQFGGFYYPDDQFWISVRRSGQRWNDTIYVLHTELAAESGDQDFQPEQVWTRLRVPEHSYLEMLLDPFGQFNGEPLLVIGTTSGQILRYKGTGVSDGHDLTLTRFGQPVLASFSNALSATSLTNNFGVEFFDQIGGGMRGMQIKIIDGSNPPQYRTIERNNESVVFWREPLSPVPAGNVNFEIGGFAAYWTSGWIAPQDEIDIGFGNLLRVAFLQLGFESFAGLLDVKNTVTDANVAALRDWPTSAALESRTQDMTKGYQEQPLPTLLRNRGRYFRMFFGTEGINKRFSVTAWGMRYDIEGISGIPR